MGQADNIRRAMSKKKQYVIDAERQSFVYGDEERGIKAVSYTHLADFHSKQGGIRNRKHEVYAQWSAHYRNYGWCQCRDVR